MSYFWPASALTVEDMAALYRVREESRPKKVPITELVVRAVRATYAHAYGQPARPPDPTSREEAA